MLQYALLRQKVQDSLICSLVLREARGPSDSLSASRRKGWYQTWTEPGRQREQRAAVLWVRERNQEEKGAAPRQQRSDFQHLHSFKLFLFNILYIALHDDVWVPFIWEIFPWVVYSIPVDGRGIWKSSQPKFTQFYCIRALIYAIRPPTNAKQTQLLSFDTWIMERVSVTQKPKSIDQSRKSQKGIALRMSILANTALPLNRITTPYSNK